MGYTVPDLPYPYDALEPHISAATMRVHHDEHHRAYVDKANAALAGTALADASARDVLTRLDELPADRRAAATNNVGGHLNHTLLWESMAPGGAARPARDGKLAAALRDAFGSFAGCTETIAQAALSQFGSGWAWLVCDARRVLIVTTANQDSPISDGFEPLLGIDVWEHAYYLDYENRRADYVEAWLRVVNWDVVEQRHAAAPTADVGHILDRLVTVCGVERRFGDVTIDDARRHATEMKALAGWGPMAKVGAVARGWSDLAASMQKRGARTVAELDPGTVERAAVELWIIAPDRSMV